MIRYNYKQVLFLSCLLWILIYTSRCSFENEVFRKRADHSSSTSSGKSNHNDVAPRSHSPESSILGLKGKSSDHNLAQSSSKVYRNKRPKSPNTYRGPSPPRKRKQDGSLVSSERSSDSYMTKELIQGSGYTRKEALRALGKPTKSLSSTETTSTVQKYNDLGYSKKEAKQLKKKGQTPEQWIREDREHQARERLNRFGNTLSRDASAARFGQFGSSKSTSNSGSHSSPRAQSTSLSYSGSDGSPKGADDEATSCYRPSNHPNKNGSKGKS